MLPIEFSCSFNLGLWITVQDRVREVNRFVVWYIVSSIPNSSNKILQKAVEAYDKSKQIYDSSVRVIFNRRETIRTHNHNRTENSTHIIKVSQTVDWRENEFSRSDLLLRLNSDGERRLRLYYEALTTVFTISTRKYYAVHFIIFLLDSSL